MTAAKDMVGSLAAMQERSRDQVARYHQIRAALEQLRVTATSTDRSVTVEMAAGGAIVDLRLTQQAMSKTPDTLASTILEAIRLGLAQVAEQTVGAGGTADRPARGRLGDRAGTVAVAARRRGCTRRGRW